MSQSQKMYDFMSHFPESTFTISDFQKEPCFIWYKASARMNELVHAWKVKVVGRDGRFSLYQAIPEWQQVPIKKGLWKILPNFITF